MLNEAWQDGDTYFTVEGAPALLDISTLVCARGGRIRFIKSSSEDFKAETTEIKTYAKLGTSEKSAEFSVGQGKMKLEGEIGEYKMNFEADSKKRKGSFSVEHSEKHDE